MCMRRQPHNTINRANRIAVESNSTVVVVINRVLTVRAQFGSKVSYTRICFIPKAALPFKEIIIREKEL